MRNKGIKSKKVKKEIKFLYPLIIALAISIVGIYLVYIRYGESIEAAYTFFSTMDVKDVQTFVASFGLKAPLVFILLQISQAVIAPIPGFIFTIAGGIVFGAFWGAVLSITGSLIGAYICFVLSKFYGRPLVKKLVGEKNLESVDRIFEENGMLLTAIFRAIPVMSFGLASYLISLTDISLKDYMLGTIIGLIPTTIFYTYLGYLILEKPVASVVVGLLLVAFFLILPLFIPILKKYFKKKKRKK